jgi:phage gp29-like protein
LTTDDSTPGFARDIQPMFRDIDRRSMRFAFDLWNYEDVCTNAEAILERLNDGSMPCDEEWSNEQIEHFSRWVEGGMPA